MIDIHRLQRRVGTPQDGLLGPATVTALFARLGAPADTAAELARSLPAAIDTLGALIS